MPHLTLEYSNNIKQQIFFEQIFKTLHESIAKIADTDIMNCKSRVRVADTYYIGNGHPNNAFVHLHISLLEGRSLDTRQEISNIAFELLKQFYKPSLDSLEMQFSVQVSELTKETYNK